MPSIDSDVEAFSPHIGSAQVSCYHPDFAKYTENYLQTIDLKTLNLKFNEMREDFKKDDNEICDAFIKTSGDFNKMRSLLNDS